MNVLKQLTKIPELITAYKVSNLSRIPAIISWRHINQLNTFQWRDSSSKSIVQCKNKNGLIDRSYQDFSGVFVDEIDLKLSVPGRQKRNESLAGRRI